MRKTINAIVNVIRFGNCRNREAVVAGGVDALRASGPGYCMHSHALYAGQLGPQSPRGGHFDLLDQRSSLNASLAWRSLPKTAGTREASQGFAESCFTNTTCTTTPPRPQASGRDARRAALTAARWRASA